MKVFCSYCGRIFGAGEYCEHLVKYLKLRDEKKTKKKKPQSLPDYFYSNPFHKREDWK
jgi:hypothetical protein